MGCFCQYISLYKDQRFFEMKIIILNMMQNGVGVFLAILYLDTINGPNFQWLLLNFEDFRGIFGPPTNL